jgi:hypothetical protein
LCVGRGQKDANRGQNEGLRLELAGVSRHKGFWFRSAEKRNISDVNEYFHEMDRLGCCRLYTFEDDSNQTEQHS